MKDDLGKDVDVNEPPADLIDPLENGAHDLRVGFNYFSPSSYTGLQLRFDEWIAIFQEVLGVSEEGWEDIRIPGASYEDNQKRQQEAFAARLPDYPLLARIYDQYEDAMYAKEEIADLQRECERARTAATGNEIALHGLQKLLYACYRALALKTRIRLVCD